MWYDSRVISHVISRRYAGDIHNSSVVGLFMTYRTMEATRLRHGWVHMFITHCPTVTLQLHNFRFVDDITFVDFVLLHNRPARCDARYGVYSIWLTRAEHVIGGGVWYLRLFYFGAVIQVSELMHNCGNAVCSAYDVNRCSAVFVSYARQL